MKNSTKYLLIVTIVQFMIQKILNNDLIHFHNKFPNINNKILLDNSAYISYLIKISSQRNIKK